MSNKIRKRDAEASKEAIIKHATMLFSEKGYTSASMDELASRCGLNKAMVFYYFKNKKGLYEAVMTEILGEIYQTIKEENQTQEQAEGALKSFVTTYARYAYAHPYLPALLLKELSDSGAVVPEVLFASMRQLFALFSEIIKKGQASGVFGEAIPMVLYFMVLGTLNLMVTTTPLRQKAAQMDDIEVDTCAGCDIDEISDYLYRSILNTLKEKR
ncbi:MAG: TetR/AcrR family transcriptional regulator [Sulfurovum sp.]|nr:MAG: TetR/AcrR family transcriptional regulator [Sulfurovum sp.]